MAMGSQADRVVLVELGNLRPFTDIAGLHIVRMDNSSPRRQELAQKLRTAGCPVNLNGEYWHTAGDFEAALVQLTTVPSESTAIEEHPSTIPDHPQLSEEAKQLLIEATRSSRGNILRVGTMGGLIIQANGKNLCERGNPKSEAIWEGALKDLIIMGLVEDQKGKGEVFVVTREGFPVANDIGDAEQFNC